MYDLTSYFDFTKIDDIDYIKSKNLKKCFNPSEPSNFILKYDKANANFEGNIEKINSLGLFRSVIFHNNKLVGFAPPKSNNIKDTSLLDKESYIAFVYGIAENKYDEIEKIVDTNSVQEFVEGTMINVYFANNEWQIATRTLIGAKGYYFHNNNSKIEQLNKEETTKPKMFRTMFLEAMNAVNLEFEHLNKDYCYSFVMQHPDNRIVIPIVKTDLYLTNVYHVYSNDYKVQVINIDEIKQQFEKLDNVSVKFPKKFETKEDIMKMFKSLYKTKLLCVDDNVLPYTFQGIVFYINGLRFKLRNNEYEYVRRLKGNQPKEQFNYFMLRQTNKVHEYLKYYPEQRSVFNTYRQQLHDITSKLYNTYVNCFILKKFTFSSISKHIQPHIFQLHKMYLDSLTNKKQSVNYTTVINYVNNLHPKQMMHLVNYPLKQAKMENIIEKKRQMIEG